MKTYGIILAGGRGLRLGADMPKQFLPLGDRPVIAWSMEAFCRCGSIDGLIILCPADEIPRMRELVKRYPHEKILDIIAGGETRQGSSWNAVNARKYQDDDILLIHDAARPFVTERIILDCVAAAKEHGAAGTYIPATDTITEIHDESVTAIPPRENLFYTQTPQAFRFDVIKKGHELARSRTDITVTDDVSLVLTAGHTVARVQGDPRNIKITTNFDYELAQWLALEKAL
jgi:2-C-methyl-D-erythritol 4-phosphate cytidylyltransferase